MNLSQMKSEIKSKESNSNGENHKNTLNSPSSSNGTNGSPGTSKKRQGDPIKCEFSLE